MENELRIVRRYWGLLWQRPLHWIVPMVLVLAVGLYVVLSAPRTYISTARIVAQSQISSNLVQSTVTSERLQFFEERVFARENLVALAEKFNMFPGVRQTMSQGQLADLVRANIIVHVTPTDPNDTTPDAAVFTVGFEAETPETAAAVTGEIISMIQRENRDARLGQASEARRFLEREVTTVQAEADRAEQTWDAFVSRNEALLPSRMAMYTAEMAELQQELVGIQTAGAGLSADIRVLETQATLGTTATDPTRAQLEAVRSELAAKLSTLSDSHPDIISLRARLKSLEDSVASSPSTPTLTPEAAMLQERITTARDQQTRYDERRTEINERLASLRSTISQMPTVEADLNRLQRDRDTAEANLSSMRARLDTAMTGERLEADQQDRQIRILDTPEVPLYPSGSGRSRAFAIVGALALAIGFASLVLLDMFDRTIKGRNDLKDVLEGATLVVLPYWDANQRSRRRFVPPFFGLFGQRRRA